MKYLLIMGCSLVFGCVAKQPFEACRIDVVMQNLGQDMLDGASVEFSSGDRLSVGVLPSTIYKVNLYTWVSISSEIKVVCEYNDVETMYLVDMGEETAEKLLSGHHVLYFQLNMDEDEVLFKCFDDEFPHDVLNSEKKLTGAIKATPIPRGTEGSSGSESSNRPRGQSISAGSVRLNHYFGF